MDEKRKQDPHGNRNKEVKSFQELSNEVVSDPNLKERQPTPQPKELNEIEY